PRWPIRRGLFTKDELNAAIRQVPPLVSAGAARRSRACRRCLRWCGGRRGRICSSPRGTPPPRRSAIRALRKDRLRRPRAARSRDRRSLRARRHAQRRSCTGRPLVSELRWEEPVFRDEAHAWIRAHVEVTAEIEQAHVRPWSTVMRVPIRDDVVWFKASAAALAHDGPVTAALARIRPGGVLEPLALDVDRGWSLLPDGGETLRSVLDRKPEPERWIAALALYSELQLEAAPHIG